MVAAKSRELVRSERLASVGYLAAGVAHEINNPLNIMSGYAELTIKRLRRLAATESDAEVIQHLSIIRSEAFRCKEITQKLLSLAKGNGDTREVLSLSDAVLEVVTLVRGLKSMRSKQLLVTIPSGEPLLVLANLTEIKQVLLNVIINAIEAVPDQVGKIQIEGRAAPSRSLRYSEEPDSSSSDPALRSTSETGLRADNQKTPPTDWIELSVSDNGRGMSRETIDRIFEPFFTNKRGAGEPGTGLGLSISHAITTDHGGEIIAASGGLNLGSRFVIRMPMAVSNRVTAPVAAQPQISVVSP